MRTAVFIAGLMATSAQADISVRFIEGAPKDRFVVTNVGDCDMTDFDLELRLDGSAAGLIFDTTSTGAGVEVFQPLEVVAGRNFLGDFDGPTDGDTRFLMPFTRLPAGDSFAFTIDVDDTLTNGQSGQIIVRGGEIEGANVVVSYRDIQASTAFNTQAKAMVNIPNCQG